MKILATRYPWGFVAFAVLLIIGFGAGRSFDFTDEGVYYLSALHPSEVSDRQTAYFEFGRVLFAGTGHSLVLTRCILAVGLLTATIIFACGLEAFLGAFAATLKSGPWLACAAISGSALAFAAGPIAPSYNLFNAFLLLTITGLVLQAVAVSPSPGKISIAQIALIAGAALLLVADFFIKFSTCAVLGTLLLLSFLLTSPTSWRHVALILGAGLLAAVCVSFGYFIFVESFSTWRRGINGTLDALLAGPYLRRELIRYAGELEINGIEILRACADTCTAILICGGALLLFRAYPVIQRRLSIAGAAIPVGVFTISPFTRDPFRLHSVPDTVFHLGVLAVLSLAAVVSLIVRRNPLNTRSIPACLRLLCLCVLLAILPYVGAFGTTNDINVNTIYQLAPWLALEILLMSLIASLWNAKPIVAIGLLPILAVSLGQFYTGYWLHPYRIPGGRPNQTQATTVGEGDYGSTLRLDPASHTFVEETRANLAAAGFKAGDDVFAFFNLPGLVFAVGGVSPGHPWYFTGDVRSLELDAMRVAFVAPARRNRAFIISNGDIRPFLSLLSNTGLDFPAAYTRCGDPLKNPLTGELVEIWRPNIRESVNPRPL